MSNERHIVWHERSVSRQQQVSRYGHPPLALWFTGLSGAGKSTLAHGVEAALFKAGWHTYCLDGDNIRHGLNGDLGFAEADRSENIRRVGEVARLFVDAGLVVLVSFISPFRVDRERVRSLFTPGEFMEIYVRCDLATCESRDPKGLYGKARAGLISDFTGINSPYEEPEEPDLVVDTSQLTIDEAVSRVVQLVTERAAERERRQ